VTFDQIDRMVREANPVPESALVDMDLDLLPDSEWRDVMRTDQTLDRDPVIGGQSPKPTPPRWLGVAAALVAVVAVIAVLTQTGLVEDEPPVADSEAALLEIAQTMAQAIAEGDSATLLGLLSDRADVHIQGLPRNMADVPALGAWWTATGSQLSPGECRLYPPPASGSARLVQCEMRGMTNSWTRALGVDPVDTVADIKIADGEVTYADLRIPGRFYQQGFGRFTAWRDQRYPEAAEIMQDVNAQPILTDESIALWRQYTEEFVAEHSGDEQPGADLEAEFLETAESMAQAITTGDAESLLALLSSDAAVGIGPAETLADIPALGEFWEAIGAQLAPGECHVNPPPALVGSTRLAHCEFRLTDAWGETLGVEPLETRADFQIRDGEVVDAWLRYPQRYQDATLGRFLDWRNENHPEAIGIMQDEDGLRLTEESVDLFRQYTEEFVAEHSAG
jgi:hypothetical protein